MTTAKQIAERFGNDGQRWQDDDGSTIDTVCRKACSSRDNDERRGLTRYTFADGSVITVAEGGWDLGYPDCYCWLDTGHTEECLDSRYVCLTCGYEGHREHDETRDEEGSEALYSTDPCPRCGSDSTRRA